MQLRVLPEIKLDCGNQQLDLSMPQVMGILNVTPDSFSDGGHFNSVDAALKRAEQIIDEGGSMVDIGGESTRPNAPKISTQEEMDRVIPVVEALSARMNVTISIDTSSPEVIQAAKQAGAHLWNDVRALTRPNALQTAAKLDIPVVLMHMRGEPDTMNDLAIYDNVVQEVIAELDIRLAEAIEAGIKRENILIDPGFGFAKTARQNLDLLKATWQIYDYFSLPLLVGLSRKRVLGEVLGGAPVDQRLSAGLAAHLVAVQQGASIIRTHDVFPTVQALKLWQALS